MRLNRLHVIAGRRCVVGVVGRLNLLCRGGRKSENSVVSGRPLEGVAVEGESPVHENHPSPWDGIPSSTEPVKFGVNLAGPPAKPEYSLVTDSGQVP